MNIRGEGESILRDAADRAAPFDGELEATLRDMAADYAGPNAEWAEMGVAIAAADGNWPDYAGPQVSDEEGDRK